MIPVAVEGAVLRIVEGSVGADVDQDLVRELVLRVEVVRVVRRNERQVEAARQSDELTTNRRVALGAVVLDLDVEPAGAEHSSELPSDPVSLRVATRLQEPRDLARLARRERDEPVGIARQEFLVRARAIVEALGVGRAHDP